jgi:hypothetical protein
MRWKDGRGVADEAVDAAGRAQLVQEAGHVIRQSHNRSHFITCLLTTVTTRVLKTNICVKFL